MRRLFYCVPLLTLITLGCQNNHEQALSITEQKRLTVDPKVGAFLIQGQQAFTRGQYAMALSFTDSAEVLAPDLADIHFLRGQIYTQLNQLEVATVAYQVTLEHDPQYKGAHYSLGQNDFRRGKLRDAISHYVEELAFAETSILQLELGRAYAKLGEPDSARMAYERAVTLDSTNATAYMWLGQLYEEMGELEKALEVSMLGIALHPEKSDYAYIAGSILNRLGRPEEALPYLSPVAEERPWHHGAQYNLGQVLMRLGRDDEATHYFARADSAQKLQQEINDAQNEINRDPENIDTWIKLGTLLRDSGQKERAIEAYKVAVSHTPWNMYLQNNLAILMMEHGDYQGAIRRYTAILNLDSTLTDVWFNLGVAYANAGEKESAINAWNTTLKQVPNHAGARAFLARADEIQPNQ